MKKPFITFVLLLLGIAAAAQTNQIRSYEYWFNDNYPGRVTTAVSPATQLNLNTSVSAASLPDGFHVLNIRFKDQKNLWSVTQSEYFLKTSGMTAYEYWFDDNYAGKVTGTLSGQQVVTLSLNPATTGLAPGLHRICLRTRTAGGSWSITQSEYFFKAAGITAYEYWFNDNYANRVSGTLTAQQDAIISLQASTLTLKAGMHVVHFRTRNALGSWSITQSQFFWKTGAQLTRYEYWFDTDYAGKKAGRLNKKQIENFALSLPLSSLRPFDVMYARFQDTAGAWSATLALPTPAPKADFFYIQDRYFVTLNNTTLLGKTYRWSFGDGKTSTLANPSYTYTQPGEYFIKLVATNAGGKDSIQQQLTIRGIQSVMPAKAGNSGVATIDINGGGLAANSTVRLTRTGFADIKADTSFIASVGKLRARFNLAGKDLGQWNVVVSAVGTQTLTAQNALTIEQGIAPKVWASVSGNNAVLFNRWQTYTFNYGNTGNIDAALAPMWLVVSDVEGLELEFLSKKMVVPNASDPVWKKVLDSIPPYIPINNLNGKPFKARAYVLFFSPVAASETNSFTFRIRSPQSYQITTWVDENYFTDTKIGPYEDCIRWAMFTAFTSGLVNLLSNQLPGAGCVATIAHKIAFYDYSTTGAMNNLKNMIWAMTRAAIDCVWSLGSEIPFVKAWNLTKDILSLGLDIYEGYADNKACKEKFKPNTAVDKQVRAVASYDPNEILGPVGYTEQRYFVDNVRYPYTITFENLRTATAPAQEVFVYDTLDATRYDLNSFAFGNFGVSTNTYVVEDGLKAFTRDIDLRPAKNLILRVNGVFNASNGVARWEFVSLNPSTMDLTEDAFGGFLPPNITSPEGEGYVSFSIMPKTSLPHLSQISNKATIIFDLNPPIVTNVWRNIIDRQAPMSAVNSLPAKIADTAFLISWGGNDAHSGIATYSVYYSENNAAPVLWKADTWAKSGIFNGKRNRTYRFFCLATDRTGNQEPTKTVYEATTNLNVGLEDEPVIVGNLALYPNPAMQQVNITYNLARTMPVSLVVYDLLAREVQSVNLGSLMAGTNHYELDVSRIQPGTYFCTVETPEGRAVQKLIVGKR